MALSFHNLSYICNGKTILRDVSGAVEAGEMLAVMGASAAGKSTLLDVLAGREKAGKVSGIVLYGSHRIGHGAGLDSGYVMQDDALIANLTVRETIRFSLELRSNHQADKAAFVMPLLLPSRSSISQPSKLDDEAQQPLLQLRQKETTSNREEVVQYIIDLLKLRHVADMRVGNQLKRGISGGERRRLSIGIELVTFPRLLFLDEPTSGLDSQSALRVMKVLQNLCRHGHSVIFTIHQPRSNIFHMFEKLLILFEGQTVYFGQANLALDYFSHLGYSCPQFTNPADFLLDILEPEIVLEEEEDSTPESPRHKSSLNTSAQPETKESANVMKEDGFQKPGDKFIVAFQQSPENAELQKVLQQKCTKLSVATHNALETVACPNTNADNRHDQLPVLQQVKILTRRTWLATVRDKGAIIIRPLAAIVIGLLVGIIFFQQSDTQQTVDNRTHSFLFLMCVFSLFCLPAIVRFIEERVLYTREYAGGYYCASAYFFATFIVEFPVLIAVVLIYGTVSYWMVGLTPHMSNFLFFLAIIFLTINVGFGVAHVISASVTSTNMALAVFMIVLVYSLLLGGFMIKVDDLPIAIRWAARTSYFNYGFEGLLVNEFADKDYGDSVLFDMGMLGANKYNDLLALVGFFIGLRVITFLLLKYVNKEKR